MLHDGRDHLREEGPEYETQVGSLLLHNSLQKSDWLDIQMMLIIHDYRLFRNVLGPIEKE